MRPSTARDQGEPTRFADGSTSRGGDRRGVAAVLTPVVLSALILGCRASGNRSGSATPPSPATTGPHPASGLLTLATHPLLTEEEGNPVRPGAEPAPLSTCVSTPLTWGAAESRRSHLRAAW